jgi:hypothetical protein
VRLPLAVVGGVGELIGVVVGVRGGAVGADQGVEVEADNPPGGVVQEVVVGG